jgi:hypothetical protein
MRKIKNEAYRFGTWHNVKKYINRMKALSMAIHMRTNTIPLMFIAGI